MSPSSCQGTASAVPQGAQNQPALRRWAEFFQARTRTPEGTRLLLSGGEVE
jgi:hypothetical protein